jgi:hypothetical protein
MDKSVWNDPEEFRPERFLDEAGKVINKDLVISFSLGMLPLLAIELPLFLCYVLCSLIE